MKKSMIEIAFQTLSQSAGPQSFLELWTHVEKEMGFTQSQADELIAQFYTDLSMDGRFLPLAGNRWDLKKRYSSSESNVDTDSLSIEDDEDTELNSVNEE